tara:strand:- start:46 stop:579 length:534 start_codon:yes stop_codon:yes gene_type:complete
MNIIVCLDETQLAQDDYMSSFQPTCKEFCLDFYFEDKPYIGIYWMVSHNLFISSKSSLMNTFNDNIYVHSLYGFDIDFINKEKYKVILSFDLNKSLYHEAKNYGWYQTSLIYSKGFNNSNLQIILDSIYDQNWNIQKLNLIYGLNIYENIFLSIGVIGDISNNDKNLDHFLTLNFNI